MKTKLIIFFFITNNYLILAQNLVPNGSFEYITTCPTSHTIELAYPWFNVTLPPYSYDICSPVVFNYCADINTFVSLPKNQYGWQRPRTGNGCAGILVYDLLTGDREYMSVKLNTTLISGYRYQIKFYVSLGNYCDIAIDRIGFFLSKDSIRWSFNTSLNINPQIESDSFLFLSDTLNWIEVKKDYIADGNEKYIIIGNFFDNSNTHYIRLYNTNRPISFCYIDDIGVYKYEGAPMPVQAGNNSILCLGDSVQLGIDSLHNYRYRWHPATGLSDTTISNPIAKPLQTTTYYLYQWDYTDELTVDSVTIIVRNCDTISKVNNLIIYPNPCRDNLYLEYTYYVPANTSVHITNAIGQTLIKQDFTTTNTKKKINISSLAAGVYFCNVYTAKELVRVERIIVIKQ